MELRGRHLQHPLEVGPGQDPQIRQTRNQIRSLARRSIDEALAQGPGKADDLDAIVALTNTPAWVTTYFKQDGVGDTATFGSWAALECGLAFFGADRVLFGTDMPFDPEKGSGFVRDTIAAMERMRASDVDKAKIYEGNARRLLRLK